MLFLNIIEKIVKPRSCT